MNRRQRRVSAKSGNSPQATPAVNTPAAPTAAPTLVLRLAASVLLSSWVLRRVRNRQIFEMLRQVAIQAGREDAVRRIDELSRQRS